MTTKSLVEMSSGRELADLLIINAKVVDVFTGTIRDTPVRIGNGKFLGFSADGGAQKIVDAQGKYLLPGLIDAHIHIESSMASPAQFAGLVLPRGTTSVIADPHEIANVHGLDGIRYMLESGRHTPLHMYIALPSCVPATPFEDAGATLSAEDLRTFINEPDVSGIGEMMNFPGVVAGDEEVLAKVELGLKHGKVVDGHAPGLAGQALDAYVVTGISSTHECTTRQEMEENLKRGVYVLIREGSAAKNLEALVPGVTDANARRCAFCCDDRHIEDIVREGHMDNHLRKAVALGMDPVQAVTLCTLNASECFRLLHKGAIAPGRDADCILVDDLKDFRVRQVFAKGELVAEDGRMLVEIEDRAIELPPSVCVGPLDESKLRITVPSGKARVIGIRKHSLVTSHEVREVRVDAEYGFHCADNPGLVKLAVIERHKGTGKVGVGLLAGYGLRDGAIATTIAHDSHNIVVAGDSDADMLLAIREVADIGGGIVTVKHGRILGRLALPVAGLMSREDPLKLSDALKEMLASARAELSISKDVEPFMALSFMALPVIPELKLTARGLFDVTTFSFVSLDVE